MDDKTMVPKKVIVLALSAATPCEARRSLRELVAAKPGNKAYARILAMVESMGFDCDAGVVYTGEMEGLEELLPHAAQLEDHIELTRQRRVPHGRNGFEAREECPHGHGSLGVSRQCSDCGYSADRGTADANLQMHGHAHSLAGIA